MAKWLLDAGHGGTDPGACYNGRRECDDTLKLTKRVGEILKANGETVEYIRTTDTTVSLSQRSQKENAGSYDYFISLHRNAFNPEQAKGVETYIYNGSYASKERNRSFATKINNALISGSGFYNRGVKEANYHVLRETKCCAILIEVGFIDNTGDNSIFDNKFESIAQAIAKGCLEQVGKSISTITTPTASTNGNLYYRVIVGSYKDKNNAIKQQKALKAKGFDSFLEAFKK